MHCWRRLDFADESLDNLTNLAARTTKPTELSDAPKPPNGAF